jgi:nucleotide-binding universal stress UspA family protein
VPGDARRAALTSGAAALRGQRSTIVVPLDAKFAEARCVATELAAPSACIVLIGVVPEATQIVAAPDGVSTAGGRDSERLEAATQAYLEAIARRADVPDVEIVHRRGDPALEVAALAHERSACVVIMATHGRTGPMRSVLGSIAGGVLHRTKTPVMVVGPKNVQPALPVGWPPTTPARVPEPDPDDT